MKYRIRIEGGFTGIPKEYQGEIDLSDSERKEIMQTLSSEKESNPQLRDGLVYNVEIRDEKFEKSVVYDEANLPPSLRLWIQQMIAKN